LAIAAAFFVMISVCH